ncbi:MAG: DUF5028 domain-containing protein [Oscillospiraceae bacterium]
MKKVLLPVVAVLLLGLLGFRIWSVNKNVVAIPVETYQMGDWVELDGAFQDVISENTMGYSVCIKSAEMKSYEDFVKEYNETEDYMEQEYRPETVLDIEFAFQNEGNAQGHIQLFQYFVEGVNFTMSPNSELWLLAVPKGEGQMGFALDENTTYSFHVPYIFQKLDSKNLRGQRIHVITSRAPVEKIIEIQL